MTDHMATLPIRPDLAEHERRFWAHLAAPGTWWLGAERIAAVAAARNATTCRLCRERKAALSPAAVSGRHDGADALPEAAVEVAHKVRTDSGRLSYEWFTRQRDGGLSEPAYVELVGIVTMATGLDMFARALGTAPETLPAPRAGDPKRRLPQGAKANGAWVPTLEPDDVTDAEADLYPSDGVLPNIAKALSLVPDEVRMIRSLTAALYMPVEHVANPTYVRGPLDRLQMELVAARVSAINECFY
jgi:alkylhydroperoxidase family enzyme